MRKLLWKPSEEIKKQANMARFISFVNETSGLTIDSYEELYDWSIEKIPDFWAAMWEFTRLKASRRYDKVVDDLAKFPGAKWFGGAKLNFAENLLGYRDDHIAFIFKGETQKSARMTYAELYNSVARLAKSLRKAFRNRLSRHIPRVHFLCGRNLTNRLGKEFVGANRTVTEQVPLTPEPV